MKYLTFLEKHKQILKNSGVKLTSKNKEKLKDAWLRKQPVTMSRLFEVTYSEAIVDVIQSPVNFLKFISKD